VELSSPSTEANPTLAAASRSRTGLAPLGAAGLTMSAYENCTVVKATVDPGHYQPLQAMAKIARHPIAMPTDRPDRVLHRLRAHTQSGSSAGYQLQPLRAALVRAVVAVFEIS
jgi:hypothetical protein